MAGKKRVLFRNGEGPVHRVRPDLDGTVIAGEGVTVVRWEVPVDRPPTPIHSHDAHEQFMILLAGEIETHVGGETIVMRPGDVLRIEKRVPHGATRVRSRPSAVWLDVFSPPREDYLAAVRGEVEK